MTESEELTTKILISIRDELRAIRTEHGAKLDEHTRILGEHTRILGEHTDLLAEHGRKLDEHSQRLEGLQLAVYEVRGELKILIAQQAVATHDRVSHLEQEVSEIKRKLATIA